MYFLTAVFQTDPHSFALYIHFGGCIPNKSVGEVAPLPPCGAAADAGALATLHYIWTEVRHAIRLQKSASIQLKKGHMLPNILTTSGSWF